MEGGNYDSLNGSIYKSRQLISYFLKLSVWSKVNESEVNEKLQLLIEV